MFLFYPWLGSLTFFLSPIGSSLRLTCQQIDAKPSMHYILWLVFCVGVDVEKSLPHQEIVFLKNYTSNA